MKKALACTMFLGVVFSLPSAKTGRVTAMKMINSRAPLLRRWVLQPRRGDQIFSVSGRN